MEYRIREYYFKEKAKTRAEIKKRVCALLGIKPQAFYQRLSGEYNDLNGNELLVWKVVFSLDSVEDLYKSQTPLKIA